MTVHKAVIIECDGCGDTFPSDSFAPGTAADHRADLRRDGWRTNLPGGHDLCDDCRASAGGSGS